MAYGAGVRALQGGVGVVEPGEVVALIGANGAGRDLLKTIAGLVEPQAGEVTFDGQAISPVDAADRVKLGVALVPEGQAPVRARLSVAENLTLGSYREPRGPATDARCSTAFTALFPVLGERARATGGDAERQSQPRCWPSARALMSRPRFLYAGTRPSLGIMPRLVVDQVMAVAAAAPREREGITEPAPVRAERARRPSIWPTAATCWQRLGGPRGEKRGAARERHGAEGLSRAVRRGI